VVILRGVSREVDKNDCYVSCGERGWEVELRFSGVHVFLNLNIGFEAGLVD
jgi:hypothetical protein